jgi:hypothetical protein
MRVLVVGLLLLPGLVWAQGAHIRTMGQGEVMVAPDTAEFGVTVRVEEKQLAAAREKAAAQMTKVLAAVRALRIPGLEIGTSQLSVTPVVKPQPDGQQWPQGGTQFRQEIIGYQVTNSAAIKITADGPALAGYASQVMDAATTSGATNFYGPSFYRKELAAAQEQALERATKDAIAKAQALARAAGLTIKSYTYIGMFPEDEQQAGPMPMMRERATMAMGAGDGTPTPVEARDIPVSAQVWVTATTGGPRDR